jgi:hypothetical protein
MKTLITFGLGALTMYLLDPQQGRTRRALMRDQLTHAKRLVSKRAEGRAVDRELQHDELLATPQSAHQLGR